MPSPSTNQNNRNVTVEDVESGYQSRRDSSSDEEWQAGAVKTKTSETKQKLADKLKDLNTTAAETKKAAVEKKEVTFANITDKAKDAQSKVQDKLKATNEAVTEKAEESKQKVVDQAQKTKSDAAAKTKEAKNVIETKVAEQKQKTEEMKKALNDKAEEAKKAAAEQKKALNDKAEEAKKAVTEQKKALNDKVEEAKKTVTEQKKALTDKAEEAKKAVEKQKQKALEMKEATLAKAEESKKMMGSKADEAKKAIEEQKKTAMELKEKAMEKANDTKKAVEAKVAEAKTAVMEQKKAFEQSANELQKTIIEQKEAISESAAQVSEQVQGVYSDISDALAPAISAGSEIRKRMPRKRVMVAGLGVAAAAAGIGYWIYKTYYADGSESVDLVAEDAASSSSWTLSSWFGSGDSSPTAPSAAEAPQPGLLSSWFGSSSSTTAPAADVGAVSDEATTLLSSVASLLDTEKAADALTNMPEMAGTAAEAALKTVEEVLNNEEVQTALRGITREFFTQLDVLTGIFAEQQKGIMAYLSARN